MNITLCLKSAFVGIIIGSFAVASAWYVHILDGRSEITRTLLATAACEATGFTTIQFADGSQFTRVPVDQMPPTSRKEAAMRKARGR